MGLCKLQQPKRRISLNAVPIDCDHRHFKVWSRRNMRTATETIVVGRWRSWARMLIHDDPQRDNGAQPEI